MCGRYVSTKASKDLLVEFDAVDGTAGQDTGPDYNVAPTRTVHTIVTRPPRDEENHEKSDEAPVRQLRLAHWGLIPSWAKDASVGYKMINARAETIGEKPAYKRAFAKRRCIVPADGWYEWVKDVGPDGKPRKQPYLMIPPDGHSLALAGLYEFWKPKDAPEDEPLTMSVTILTVPAVGELERIHDRMPLVLAHDAWERWLDPNAEGPENLLASIDEAGRESLELRPVSPDVGNVKNNYAGLIERIELAPEAQELF